LELFDGLYDSVITSEVEPQLADKHLVLRQVTDPSNLDAYLTHHFANRLEIAISNVVEPEQKIAIVNGLLGALGDETANVVAQDLLRAVVGSPTTNLAKVEIQPEIPLSELALLTNAKGDPSIGSELPKELLSADRVDILMAFIKVSGLNRFYEALKELKANKVPVRLITSAYIGATERQALDTLVSDLNVEVKVDYLARANRLHAKAWLLTRNTGFSTAFVGSSNISNPAMSSGLEWNIRLSQAKSPEVIAKIASSFESYWNSDSFEGYNPEQDRDKLDEALQRAGGKVDDARPLTLSMLDVRPYPHQTQMLAELQFEREHHGFHRNLVVAATGSGKTVLAALDFKRYFENNPGCRLLFVAHRKEMLEQSRSTFAQVLRDASFGELLVDGQAPKTWNHVFASIQSLTDARLSDINPEHFDYIVVDEFHHASAPTYKRLIERLQPRELLGLTATPERADGVKVQDLYFGGRIASELRLWDALDQELLAPFSYFGIGEDTDFTGLTWRGNLGYDTKELSNVLTGNDARDRLLLSELNRKVAKFEEMRCLAFCVDVKHAEYMAYLFNKQGIPAASVTGLTPQDQRQASIAGLRTGSLKVLTSVDVFNEGLDIPNVNTVVMLRPTESPVIFLQQLGRGLRKAEGKSEVLVLDFIGAHRAQYRLDLKLSVLSGRTRGEIEKDVENNFPYLPSGVSISLDKMAREKVLANLKAQVAPKQSILVAEIASTGVRELGSYLELAAREPWEIYRLSKASWTLLASEAGLLQKPSSQNLESISKFLHVNDPERFEAYPRFSKPGLTPWAQASDRERRLRNMFFWQMWPDAKDLEGQRWASVDVALGSLAGDSEFAAELEMLMSYLDSTSRNSVEKTLFRKADVPLATHANYSRYEIMGATGKAYLEGSEFGYPMAGKSPDSISFAVEGVHYLPEIDLDIFYITLKKGSQFSSTTRYLDYAESSTVFHWESQNKTSIQSKTGQRYINQNQTGHDVLLCVRESSDTPVRAQTFKIVGLADYLSHEGSSPISLRWKLRIPLDLPTFKIASAVRVA
jgi:superfamily II DNA or RNA helicase/HKD family nuclease